MQYRNIQIMGDDLDWVRACDAARHAGGCTCCPVCRKGYDNRLTLIGKQLTYECGGYYRRTVDLDGNPVWAGRCGAKMTQKLLAFEEVE